MHKRTHGRIPFVTLVKTISSMWTELSLEERKKYNELADVDSRRYYSQKGYSEFLPVTEVVTVQGRHDTTENALIPSGLGAQQLKNDLIGIGKAKIPSPDVRPVMEMVTVQGRNDTTENRWQSNGLGAQLKNGLSSESQTSPNFEAPRSHPFSTTMTPSPTLSTQGYTSVQIQELLDHRDRQWISYLHEQQKHQDHMEQRNRLVEQIASPSIQNAQNQLSLMTGTYDGMEYHGRTYSRSGAYNRAMDSTIGMAFPLRQHLISQLNANVAQVDTLGRPHDSPIRLQGILPSSSASVDDYNLISHLHATANHQRRELQNLPSFIPARFRAPLDVTLPSSSPSGRYSHAIKTVNGSAIPLRLNNLNSKLNTMVPDEHSILSMSPRSSYPRNGTFSSLKKAPEPIASANSSIR